jgi:hypothetical protein
VIGVIADIILGGCGDRSGRAGRGLIFHGRSYFRYKGNDTRVFERLSRCFKVVGNGVA